MSDSIQILLSSNRSFAPLMLVTVRSLLLSATDPSRIHLTLIERGIPQHLRELLEVYVEQANARLTVIENAPECFRDNPAVPMSFHDLPDTGHYDRLLAPYLFPDSDKVLYLDSDLYVQSDLFSLWNSDCGGFPLAAVRDQNIPEVCVDSGIIDWRERCLDPKTPYFNSGVMLISLKKWREQGIAEACIGCASDFIFRHNGPPPLHDQYALNVVCCENWMPLDRCWNSFAQKIRGRPEDAKIVHFAGAQKPFHPTSTFSGASRYFIRLAQKLVQSDLDFARESAESYSKIRIHRRHHDTFQRKLLSPNRRNVTFASAGCLSELPDLGGVVMVIPVRIDDPDSLRYKNFRFLLEQYRRHLPHVVLSEQIGPKSAGLLSRLVDQLQDSSVHHLKIVVDDPAIHKARLINEASRFAFDELKARYVWQMDADIYLNPSAVLNQLSALNSRTVPVVRPLLFFIRLEAPESEKVLSLTDEQLVGYDPGETPVSPFQIIDLFGPGTLIFSRDAFEETGGLDESFSGWGWEDMDFAERLRELHTPHTLPLIGIHLHHEEDRVPNTENFTRYRNVHFGDTDQEEIDRILGHTVFHNYLTKFCLITFDETPLVSEIDQFCSSDESVVFRPSPINPDCFPTRRELASSIADQVVYSLFANSARFAGFAWKATAPISLPDSYGKIRDESLVDFLIAANFRIVLVEPQQNSATTTLLSYRRIRSLLINSCDSYSRDFGTLVKQLPSAGVEPETAVRVRDCLSHFCIPQRVEAISVSLPTESPVR